MSELSNAPRRGRGRRKIGQAWIAGLAGAALVLAGCSAGSAEGGPSSDGAVTEGDTLTFGAGLPGPLNPRDSYNNGAGFLTYPAYSSLMEYNEEGELVPGLAAEWGYADTTNTVFTITLKPDVVFADGTPITAEDVVNSVEYFQGGAGPSVGAVQDLTIEAADDLTVTVTSPTPNPAMADLFGQNSLAGAIISPAGLADPDKLSSENFGAGPYVLDTSKTVPNSVYYFDKNENYWDADNIHYKHYVVRTIGDESALLQALQAGQVDFIGTNSEGTVQTAASAGFQVVEEFGNFWTGIHILDQGGTMVPALANEQARQAINYAIDRESIARDIYGSIAEPTSAPTLDTWVGFTQEANDYYSYDPEKAKELLAEAGYPDGFTMPITYSGEGGSRDKMIQAIAQQLSEVGITLELQPTTSPAEMFGAVFGGTTPLTEIPISAFNPFVMGSQQWLPGGVVNPLGNIQPEYTAAFERAAVLPTEEAGPAWEEAYMALVESAWTVPVVKVKTAYLLSKDVGGVVQNPQTGLLLFYKLHPAN